MADSIVLRKKAGPAGLSVLCCCDGSRMSSLAFGVAARKVLVTACRGS